MSVHTINLVQTKCCEHAENMEISVMSFVDYNQARTTFDAIIKRHIDEILDNKYLKTNTSIYKDNALITIEGTKYAISIVQT